jgi:hypothetical protein
MRDLKKKALLSLLLFILCAVSLSACNVNEEADGPKVTPDTGSYLKLEVKDSLGAVAYPEAGRGAADFAPCFIQYKNGDIDGWYTVSGAMTGETWIVHNTYDSDKKTWSAYKGVIQTESGTLTSYSVSQPSAVKMGDFYYVAYTGSSNNEEGTQGNCSGIFVARAKQAEGPYEKWNGEGWGGSPKPFLYYDGPDTMQGAGGVSLVELDGTLYIYYTWNSADRTGTPVSEIRLDKASAQDPDWPGALQPYGSVCKGKGQTSDLEVKYSEETGKMFAVGIESVSDTDRAIVCFEGNTPEQLTRVSAVRSGIYNSISSIGISGSVNGHIRAPENGKPFIMYSYESMTGNGYTYRIGWAAAGLFLAEHTDISGKPGYLTEGAYLTSSPVKETEIMSVFADLGYQELVTDTTKPISLSVMDQKGNITPLPAARKAEVVFSDYDEDIIAIENAVCRPLKGGITKVKVSLDGASSYFTVAVYENLNEKQERILSIDSFRDTVRVSLSEKSAVQLRAIAENSDGTYWEIYRDITYSGYDKEIVQINSEGTVTPLSEGKTEVTMTYRQLECKITVIVTS